MSLKVVKTQYGLVEGLRSGIPTTIAFRGIPFAAPPVGALRWREPQPPKPWDGILPCFEHKPVCMQERRPAGSFAQREFYAYQPPCSEDSLYLNLYTPAESASDRLPVMVYLYGGANSQGYSCKMEADGDMLCKHGVIYVCAAYRLGVFGFLAHPALSEESGRGSGNYGLLDQITALRWVRDNIAAFGGDPDCVTVFGQSAGGVNLQTLACSPLAKGLFHRGVSQSAGGLLPPMDDEPLSAAEKRGRYLQEISGCRSLSDLRSLPAERILQLAVDSPADGPLGQCRLPIAVDGYVLPESMPQALAHGRRHNIPFIIGCTSDEDKAGGVGPDERLSAAALQKKIDAMYRSYAPQASGLYQPRNEHEAAVMGHQVWGDAMLLGVRKFADASAALGLENVYVYLFNRQMPDADGVSRSGAFHSADLWYTFGNFYRSWRPMTGVDFELARAMTGYWTNFAKTGDPNGGDLPRWTAFGATRRETMLLGERIARSSLSDHPVVRCFG